jgi:hypothetical protein
MNVLSQLFSLMTVTKPIVDAIVVLPNHVTIAFFIRSQPFNQAMLAGHRAKFFTIILYQRKARCNFSDCVCNAKAILIHPTHKNYLSLGVPLPGLEA